MQAIHKDLPPRSFEEYNGYITTAYCLDSGMRATEACRTDISGNRTATGSYFPGDEPTSYCNLHKTITVCAETNKVATDFCPETKEVSMLDLTRQFPVPVSVSDQYRCFTGENLPIGVGMVVSGGSGESYQEECPIHNEFFDPEAPEGEPGTTDPGLQWPNLFGPPDGSSGTQGNGTSNPSGNLGTGDSESQDPDIGSDPNDSFIPFDPNDPENQE